MTLTIRPVTSTELDRFVPELIELLVETVNHGVPLGFLPPITEVEALQYWQDLKRELDSGHRLLLVALDDGRVVGSGQLAHSTVRNAYHRSEVQKLFVDSR